MTRCPTHLRMPELPWRGAKLRSKHEEAGAVLEPKRVDGDSSRDETRLLGEICQDEGGRTDVVLGDAKPT